MKKIISIVFITFSFINPAFALDLHEARSKGLVQEQPSGYISAVQRSSDVESLVAEVNSKRRSEYERIAKENGQSVEIVGKLAAQEISKKLK